MVVLQADFADAGYDREHIPGARRFPVSAVSIAIGNVGPEFPFPDSVRGVFEALGVSENSRAVIYYGSDAPGAARTFVALDYIVHPSAFYHSLIESQTRVSH